MDIVRNVRNARTARVFARRPADSGSACQAFGTRSSRTPEGQPWRLARRKEDTHFRRDYRAWCPTLVAPINLHRQASIEDKGVATALHTNPIFIIHAKTLPGIE
jgi:hypothetical protein